MSSTRPGGPESLRRLRIHLAEKVAADSVEVFRRVYGVVAAWQMLMMVANERGYQIIWGTMVKFSYNGFEWLPHPPDVVMKALCWFLLVCGLAILLGIFTRIAAGIYGLGYGFVMLYDPSNFNNHDYLIALLGILLAAVPETGIFRGSSSRHPRTIPRWCLWILRFQISMPYVFGGLVKLNYDWLIRHEPMTTWFRRPDGVSGLKRMVDNPELWGTVLSLGGVAFDLAIVPLLLWRKTRIYAFFGAAAFHLTNAKLFNIGPFPYLMLAAGFLFLDADWPQRLRLTRRVRDRDPEASSAPLAAWTTGLLAVWIVIQLVLPVRHFAYPGWVDWTEQGQDFGWRMKLRDKVTRFDFQVRRDGGQWQKIEGLTAALTAHQLLMMQHRPEMVRQFAHFLRKTLDPSGRANLEIRLLGETSLNSRPAQPLIDPDVDLLSLEPNSPADEWLVPLRPIEN